MVPGNTKLCAPLIVPESPVPPASNFRTNAFKPVLGPRPAHLRFFDRQVDRAQRAQTPAVRTTVLTRRNDLEDQPRELPRARGLLLHLQRQVNWARARPQAMPRSTERPGRVPFVDLIHPAPPLFASLSHGTPQASATSTLVDNSGMASTVDDEEPSQGIRHSWLRAPPWVWPSSVRGIARNRDTLEGMAKDQDKKAARAAKKPGRIKQMWQVYQTTKEHDRNLTLWLLLAFIAPVAVGVLVAALVPGNWLSWVLWIVTGLLLGVLLVMIVLGRRAEKAAYQQIEGRPGAVGAVIQGALRRSWRGSETPIAMNPRTQDAVYRVVGRGGVVLITEGPFERTKRLRIDEERKVRRVLPNVKITHLQVGPDEGSVPLHKLSSALVKIKPTLRKAEVQAVHLRLASLQSAPVGIPKGIDPNKVRSQRPR